MSSITDFFANINFSGWADNIKLIFGFLTFFFLGLGIFSYIKGHLIFVEHQKHSGGHGVAHATEHEETSRVGASTPQDFTHTWAGIRAMAESQRDSDWKLAIIEADKLVDEVLQQSGFPGETMGERLMLMNPDRLTSLQDLWDAHKLRNLLVHEMDYHIQNEQARGAINAFERVLRELGAVS